MEDLWRDEPEPGQQFETVNGAWRSIDGRFWQLPTRRFRADGRSKPLPEPLMEEAQTIVRLLKRAANGSPLVALQSVGSLRRHVDKWEHEAVVLARSCGWSWRDIAPLLGISATAAHRRFARPDVRPRRRRPPI